MISEALPATRPDPGRLGAWRVAARLAWRELRRPPPLALAAALALGLGSAALGAVGTLSARLTGALASGTAELMGGDVQVSATHDLRPALAGLEAGLAPHAVAIELPTMAAAGEQLALVELKAVDAGYPLYGELRVDGRPVRAPRPGEAWVDAAVLAKLGVAVGGTLELGEARVTVAGVIDQEPDRLAGPFRLGPRVLVGLDELAGTKLVTPLSRVRTELLYRAPRDADRLSGALEKAFGAEAQVRTAREGLETTRGLLAQAEDFLRMAAAMGLLVALAAAASVDALIARQAGTVAVLRALGAPRSVILGAQGAVLLTLGLAAGVIGAAAGAGLAALTVHFLRALLPADLPPGGLAPLALGAGCALVLALAMGVPAIVRLAGLAPATILRESAPPDGDLRANAGGALLAATGCGGLLIVLAQRPAATAAVLGGLGVLAVGMLLAGRGLARLLARVRVAPFAWRYASGAAARAPAHTALAVTALALAVLASLAPALIAGDLLAQWQQRVPPDAPNRFLIDVQADQRAEAEAILAAHGARDVALKPVVRARLTARNGAPFEAPDAQGRRFAEREQNLTSAAQIAPGNRVVVGRWWNGVPALPEVSVEADFAADVGLALGDTLEFEVAGQRVTARVTSLREVDWETLRSNFFLVLSPRALEGLPTTWVTSFRVDGAHGAALERALTGAHPNLTVLDLDAIKRTLDDLVGRLSAGAAAVSVAAALSGLAVLLAAVLAERVALVREAALLRALGASRRRIHTLHALRFTLLGGMAGVVGTGAALLAAAVGSAYFLGVAYRPDPLLVTGAVVLAAALAGAVGALGARGVLASAPMATLRGR